MAAPVCLVKNLRDGVMTIKDGTGTPNECELFLDTGDLQMVVAQQVIPILDRGKIDGGHLRYGDDVPMKVSFSELFKTFLLKGAITAMPWEALTQTGGAAAWVTTTDDNSDVYTTDLEFLIAAVATGLNDELIVLPSFWHDDITFQEGDPNTLAASGGVFKALPTITDS